MTIEIALTYKKGIFENSKIGVTMMHNIFLRSILLSVTGTGCALSICISKSLAQDTDSKYNHLNFDGSYACTIESKSNQDEWSGEADHSLIIQGNFVAEKKRQANQDTAWTTTEWSYTNQIINMNGIGTYSVFDLTSSRLILYTDQKNRWNCKQLKGPSSGRQEAVQSLLSDTKRWGSDNRLGKIGEKYYYDNPYNGDIEVFQLIGLGSDNKYWYFPTDKTDNKYWTFVETIGGGKYNEFNIDGEYSCKYEEKIFLPSWEELIDPQEDMDIDGKSVDGLTHERAPADTTWKTSWTFDNKVMKFENKRYGYKQIVVGDNELYMYYDEGDNFRQYCHLN